MAFEVALASAEALVGQKRCRREIAQSMAGATAFVVAAPVAPPRLWAQVGDAVATAFERALGNEPPTAAAAQNAIAAAAAALETLRGQLVEPHLLVDAQLGVVLTLADGLFCALTEGVRIHRARAGVPEQMHPKAVRPVGISAGPLFSIVERAQVGDLFILGTRDAFTVRAIGNLAGVLARGPRVPVSEISDAIIGPCREAGIGAAAVVLRKT
jgi:hypothetical protein